MAIVSVSRTSITDEGRSRSLIAVSPAEVIGGMVLITPTSIASTGTGNSSSIGANGSVTFDTCATLSLNGVFSATYDNYMIVMRHLGTAVSSVVARFRVSGVDDSGTNYTRQSLSANNTIVSASRDTSQTSFRFAVTAPTQRSGDVVHVYGPGLAAPTATRNVNVYGDNNATLYDNACTHSLSTSYDGLTIIPGSGSLTGLVSVYGLVGA